MKISNNSPGTVQNYSQLTQAMDTFKRVSTNDNVGDGSAVVQNEDSVAAAGVLVGVAVMVLGDGSDTIEPERVGMLRVCAAAMLATSERSATLEIMANDLGVGA
jgi:hypothetical protein